MGDASTRRRKSLERLSPTLFLVAGALLVAYAVLNGVAAAAGIAHEPVEDVVGPAGFALGFVGLVGLYPGLAERSPKLARTGAVSAALGAVGFSAIALGGLVQIAGAGPPGWLTSFVLLAAIGMIGGYLSAGVASLRSDDRSPTVGVLLLLPAGVFAVMLSQAVLFVRFGAFTETAMAWSAVAISGGQALAHLAIGYTLRTGTVPADEEIRSGDVTAS